MAKAYAAYAQCGAENPDYDEMQLMAKAGTISHRHGGAAFGAVPSQQARAEPGGDLTTEVRAIQLRERTAMMAKSQAEAAASQQLALWSQDRAKAPENVFANLNLPGAGWETGIAPWSWSAGFQVIDWVPPASDLARVALSDMYRVPEGMSAELQVVASLILIATARGPMNSKSVVEKLSAPFLTNPTASAYHTHESFVAFQESIGPRTQIQFHVMVFKGHALSIYDVVCRLRGNSATRCWMQIDF